MDIFGVLSLIGGLALFLYGMHVMGAGLEKMSGGRLERILENLTSNPLKAVLLGAGVTAVIQSSSATTVMVVGFVNSGIMKLSQAIGIIMGANIGTTITAQITAFNISTFTPLLLFAGAIMYLFMKNNFVKHVGSVIMGFGMLFQGITMMKVAIQPLSQSEGFVSFLSTLNNPALAILFGIAFTALLQSSSSSTVIFQAFAIQGLLSYNVAVYLVIGAAIGSVTPNLLASLTANRNGKRAAILNLLFNVFRAGILIALINIFPIILTAIQSLSPNDIGRQLANTHTIFAIIAVLVELPFTGKLIWLAEKIVPVLPEENQQMEDRSLVYMTQLTKVPAPVALRQTQREITRMGHIAADNLQRALDCFFHYNSAKAASVRSHEESVNILNHLIADAMVDLRSLDLSPENMRRVSMMTIAVTDIERLSDHAENIVEYIEQMNTKKAEMSDAARKELIDMSKDAMDAVYMALDIFEKDDYNKLDQIEILEQHVDDHEKDLINNHIERIMNSLCNPLSAVIFSDLVTDLERCSDHAINLAYALKERPSEMDAPKII